MEKEIKGFSGYTITDDGKIISYKYKNPKVMKTWYQKSGYENIKLCKNNITYHFLVHRLVGEAFLENKEGLPEINHKDKNKANNKVENLEWCDRKKNLLESYETMSPTRNFCKCNLYTESGKFIETFQCILDAAKYANKNFGCSISGMIRNYKSKGYKIIKCND